MTMKYSTTLINLDSMKIKLQKTERATWKSREKLKGRSLPTTQWVRRGCTSL